MSVLLDYTKLQCLYSGKYGNIYNSGYQGLIICEYLGVWRVDDKECVKDFEAGVSLLIKNKAIVNICDHRKQHVITQDITNWLLLNWYRKLYNAGLKYEIIISPELKTARISFNRLVSKDVIEGIIVETYDSLDSAFKRALKYIK